MAIVHIQRPRTVQVKLRESGSFVQQSGLPVSVQSTIIAVDASDVALAQLHDVDVSGLANGDLLIYSSTSNTWVVIPSSSIQGQNTNPGGSNTYIQFDDSGAF